MNPIGPATVLLRAPDGSSVRIDRFPVVLGRFHPQAAVQPDCDLSPLDPEGRISRQHAELDVVDGQLVVSDLGSTNGSWLDGRRLIAHQRTPMGLGGELTLGHVSVAVELAPAGPASGPEQAFGRLRSGEPTILLDPAVAPAPALEPAVAPAPALDPPVVPVPAGDAGPVVESEPGQGPLPPHRTGRPREGAHRPQGADIGGAPRISVLRVFDDPAVTQLVASPGRLPRIETGGRWTEVSGAEVSAAEWEELTTAWAAGATAAPPLDVALLDTGLFAELILPPAAAEPTLLAQRRPEPLNLDGMVAAGRLDVEAASIMRCALDAGDGMLIAGRAGSGRTSLLGALVDSLPPGRRAVVVERRPTVRFTSPLAVRLRCPRQGSVSAVALGLAVEPAWLVIDDADPIDAGAAAAQLATGRCSCVMAARTPDPDRWRQRSVEALAGSAGDEARASRCLDAVFPFMVRLPGQSQRITRLAISRA